MFGRDKTAGNACGKLRRGTVGTRRRLARKAQGMNAIAPTSTVAVVGTGTMGQGIAQVALLAGHSVRLLDAAPGRAEQAERAIGERLDRLVAKGRLDKAVRDAAAGRLNAAADVTDLAGAALVVEAILEDLGAKQQLFTALESVVGEECLLATNTSSLSVTAVAAALRLPGRLAGLHFFNPAPLMPLVEVVSGAATDPAAAEAVHDTAVTWGKTPVSCADTPGFVVNRIARPFYAEAFRVHEERGADPATIDALLRESGGFRMGPFELTDLIGQDVNEAVTRSVWESFWHDPRFTPSLAQRRLVEAGRLGRKTGRGWYAYGGDGTGTGSGPGSGPGGNDDGDGPGRPEPHTAAPAVPPAAIAVHGDLGPADALPALFEEAGITVAYRHADGRFRRPGELPTEAMAFADGRAYEEERKPGFVLLPDGTPLALTDGALATGAPGGPGRQPGIRFDLALDYRAATRIGLAPADGVPREALEWAVGLFQAVGKKVSVIDDVPGMVVARTVAMIVDFAVDAVARGVATAADVETAMRLGVGYPRGPLEWGDALGPAWVRDVLARLHAAYPGGRYAPSGSLVRRAASGRGLL
jgi:3-hydroxybutyryl-CoA dehydrogenase